VLRKIDYYVFQLRELIPFPVLRRPKEIGYIDNPRGPVYICSIPSKTPMLTETRIENNKQHEELAPLQKQS
jgi:hypothetical protein